jgi:hypothetical protein
LLNEKKTAWSAYVNPKEGADETKLEKAYNTAATEVQKYLSEKRGSSPTATPNAPTPVSPQTPTAPAAPKGPAKVQYGSPEYEAVPAHTQYMDENGNMRWKGGPPPAAQPNADAPAPAPVANTAPTKFGKSDFDAAMKDLTPRQHQVALNAFDAALADKLGLKGEQIGASRFSTSPTNQLRSGLKAHPDARLEGITDKDASELYWKALQAAKASNP